MSLARIVETIIQNAQERGEFDHLKNHGKPPGPWRLFRNP